ncbi:uncharacterized protein LOC132748265 [Ruditapes philippinarum]|uniref:uncharacterized protein LOC132748265 n=1 Tax=Ruditapes philippinarum TaxID=129788 RepID=UPI00295A67E9|nr:uncharacterized protein LOC132748265 [Ruditapes philippinarum]
MDRLCVFLFSGLIISMSESRTIIVMRSTCGGTYSVHEDDYLYFHYLGVPLPPECMFRISASASKRVCSESEKFDVDCGTRLEYYQTGYSSSYTPDKWYSCTDKQRSDFCADTSKTLHVVFKNNATNTTSSEIKLQLSIKEDEGKTLGDAAISIVYVIIGVIIAVVVLAILTTAFCVFIFCRRRRRQRHAGSVYRAPLPTVATTATSESPL